VSADFLAAVETAARFPEKEVSAPGFKDPFRRFENGGAALRVRCRPGFIHFLISNYPPQEQISNDI
jgi:hypothetical protein